MTDYSKPMIQHSPVTLITTVLNEGESITRLLDSIAAQTRPPDEVVIVDGGSSDDTVAIIHRYHHQLNLRVVVKDGCNISAGRNLAIALAAHDIIAATDAGTRLAEDWLERITTPFTDSRVQVVAGFFRADPHTAFEVAMGATVLPLREDVTPEKFLPSSRSIAFRKSAWQAVNGYPEWIDYCEDLIFDLRLKQRFSTPEQFVFVPTALVDFRPRGSLRSFFKQYYRYARGDGKADLWRKRHLIRYATYAVGMIMLLLGLLLHPLLWLPLSIGALLYLYRPYRRLPVVMNAARLRLSPVQIVYAILLIPMIRVVGDLAKMLGYPVGLRWRAQQHPPNWRVPDTTKTSSIGM